MGFGQTQYEIIEMKSKAIAPTSAGDSSIYCTDLDVSKDNDDFYFVCEALGTMNSQEVSQLITAGKPIEILSKDQERANLRKDLMRSITSNIKDGDRNFEIPDWIRQEVA